MERRKEKSREQEAHSFIKSIIWLLSLTSTTRAVSSEVLVIDPERSPGAGGGEGRNSKRSLWWTIPNLDVKRWGRLSNKQQAWEASLWAATSIRSVTSFWTVVTSSHHWLILSLFLPKRRGGGTKVATDMSQTAALSLRATSFLTAGGIMSTRVAN